MAQFKSPVPITVDTIMASLPPLGKSEPILDYLKRMGWSHGAFATVCVESRSVLVRLGFGMIGHTRSEGKNFVKIDQYCYSYVRRMQ